MATRSQPVPDPSDPPVPVAATGRRRRIHVPPPESAFRSDRHTFPPPEAAGRFPGLAGDGGGFGFSGFAPPAPAALEILASNRDIVAQIGKVKASTKNTSVRVKKMGARVEAVRRVNSARWVREVLVGFALIGAMVWAYYSGPIWVHFPSPPQLFDWKTAPTDRDIRLPLQQCGYTSWEDFSWTAYPRTCAGLGLLPLEDMDECTTAFLNERHYEMRTRRQKLIKIWHPDKYNLTGLGKARQKHVWSLIEQMYKAGMEGKPGVTKDQVFGTKDFFSSEV